MSEERMLPQVTDEKFDANFRRRVRASYLALHHRIHEEKDEISSVTSNKFQTIINDVDKLHEHVVKPREQVSDAEILLDLTSTLLHSAKENGTGNVTPHKFVSSLIRQFGRDCQRGHSHNAANLVHWKDIGRAVAPVFRKARGCLTMIGPLELKIKQRKATFRRYDWLKPRFRPKEINNVSEEQTDTEKNIHMMFKILKEKKIVKLENLILNRHSFAQTVENLFALSFLVRDGRVAVKVDDNCSHFVSPRNAPDAKSVVSEEVKYNQFIFRLDFSDWKLMINFVPDGEELMPNRDFTSNTDISEDFMHNPDTYEKFTHNADDFEDEFESKDLLTALLNKMPVTLDFPDISQEEYELKVFEMPSNTTLVTELSRKRQWFVGEDIPEIGRATNSNPNCKRKLF